MAQQQRQVGKGSCKRRLSAAKAATRRRSWAKRFNEKVANYERDRARWVANAPEGSSRKAADFPVKPPHCDDGKSVPQTSAVSQIKGKRKKAS